MATTLTEKQTYYHLIASNKNTIKDSKKQKNSNKENKNINKIQTL